MTLFGVIDQGIGLRVRVFCRHSIIFLGHKPATTDALETNIHRVIAEIRSETPEKFVESGSPESPVCKIVVVTI